MPTTATTTAPVAGFRVSYHQADEFARVVNDVFKERDYDLGDLGPAPRIIDGGAYIGVAALFFKKRYPDATVISFEPSPDSFALLRQNLEQNRVHGVEAINAALAARPGRLPFHVVEGGSWGDAIQPGLWTGQPATRVVEVEAMPLAAVLAHPVALLKLDIEGAETGVLEAAAPALGNVQRLVLEFHGSEVNPENNLERLLRVLHDQRFTVEIQQDGSVVDEAAIRRDEPFWLMIRAWAPGVRRARRWPGWLRSVVR